MAQIPSIYDIFYRSASIHAMITQHICYNPIQYNLISDASNSLVTMGKREKKGTCHESTQLSLFREQMSFKWTGRAWPCTLSS